MMAKTLAPLLRMLMSTALLCAALPGVGYAFNDCDGDGIDDSTQLIDTFQQVRDYNPDDTPGFIDAVEGDIEVDGMYSVFIPGGAPPSLSDVTITLDAGFGGWVSVNDPERPDKNLLIYVNGTLIGRAFDGTNDNTVIVPQATWNALNAGAAQLDVILEFSSAAGAEWSGRYYYSTEYLTLSYLYDRDVNDNGWLDNCVPDGDPSGLDTDGDGVSDNIDRSPNTIADPSLVDAQGNLLRVARFDADEDGDVDMSDFDLLDAATRDVDGDGTADLHDLASILHGARGPGVAADPAYLQEFRLFKAHTFSPDDIPFWHKPLAGSATSGYDNANAICQALYGTHLASIDKTSAAPLSQSQQIAQLGEITAASGSAMSWIGLKWSRGDTAFLWENGQFFKTSEGSQSNWIPGQQIPGSGFFTPGQDDYYVFTIDEAGNGAAEDYYWYNGDGETASLGEQTIEGFVAQLPENTVPAAPETTTETVTVTLDSSLNGQGVLPGQTIDWTISFEVSSDDNSGLALLVADLEQNPGNPSTFDLPVGDAAPAAMQNFAAPLGFTGAGGFGGQQSGNAGALNLAEIGGAQNTFGGASSNIAQGQGSTVVSGIGQSGSTVLATGSLTAPATLGTYTFSLANTLASVLKTVGGTGAGSETVPANITLAQGSITIVVNTAPVITLLGDNSLNHEVGTPYTDAGATASDAEDGNLTGSLVVNNGVNPNALGSYSVTYNVSDSSGLPATEVTRTVNVVDTTPPVITLLGSNLVTIEVGDSYTDAGATALDSFEGNLTASVTVSGSVNNQTPGSYVLTYNVSDSSNNAATPVTRTVIVDDNDPPAFADATVSLSVEEATTGVVYQAVADDPDQGAHPGYLALFLTDEGTGAGAVDALGSGLTYSFNAARWTVDPTAPGGGNVLDTGVVEDDSWFTVSDFDVSNGLTVSEWLRFDELQTNLTHPLIWQFGDLQVANVDGSLGVTGTGGVGFWTASPFVDGEWAHLIFSIAPDGNAVLYLNGEEILSGHIPFDSSLTDNTFGHNYDDTLSGTNGARSDLAIIDGVVNATQAQMLYQSALDGHLGDVLRYSLGSAGGDEVFFSINAYTGELSLNSALSFETPQDANGDNVYQVEIIATDDQGLSSSQIVEITIVNTNIAPVISGTLVDPIPENTGYYVYNFTVADTDTASGDLIFQLSDDRFTVSGDGSGGYRVHRIDTHNFNYENIPSYDFDLTVSDGVEEDRVNIAFTLVNLNDNPPVAHFTSAGSVTENDPGVILGTLDSITDADGTTDFYIDLDSTRFEVAADGRTIKLKDGVSLDYEANPAPVLVITVWDEPFGSAFGNYDELSSPITLLDVNDVAPHNLQLSANQVTENDTGAVIGTLSAVDEDGPSLSFSISDARFAVAGTTLKLATEVALDYETTPSVTLTVTASDGNFEASQNFTITVLNVDEGGPENITLSNASIPENTTGVIGQLSATDVDGDAISFSVTDSRFAVSGTTLELVSAINRDSLTDGTVALDVTATAGGVSATETFIITIEDVNEAPKLTMTLGNITSLTGTYTDLPALENVRQVTLSYPGDPLYPMSFVATDVDDDALTYVLGGADAAAFTIDEATGALLFVTPADFEAPGDANGDGVYEVTVAASDGELESNTITLTLTVLNVTDEFAVTPSAGTGGSIDPDAEQMVNQGDTIAFTVTPDAGYSAVVEGTCGGALVGNTYTTDPITGDCTVEARFTGGDTVAFSTVIDGNGSGNLTGTTDDGDYPPGTLIALAATADSGSVFLGWSPATCVDGFTLEAETTCTATFALECAQSWTQGAYEWKLVTLSCDPGGDNRIDDIFGDDFIGVPYYQDWALWALDPTTPEDTYPVFPTTDGLLEQGHAYWMLSREATLVTVEGWQTQDRVTGDDRCPAAPEDGCYLVALTPPESSEAHQYNMVGNPFPYPVRWADVRFVINGTAYSPSEAADENLAYQAFWRYNGAGFEPFSEEIPGDEESWWQPNEGLHVRLETNSQDSVAELWIPALQAVAKSDALVKHALETDASAEALLSAPEAKRASWWAEWAVRLAVSNEAAGLEDRGNWLGQRPGARTGQDRYDLAELDAAFGENLSLAFPHSEWGLADTDFATDFHPVSGRRVLDTWRFVIRQDESANKREEALADLMPMALGDTVAKAKRSTSINADQGLVLTWEGPQQILKRSTLVDLTSGEEIPATERRYVIPAENVEPAFEWRYRRN